MRESNDDRGKLNRRDSLKLIAAGGLGVAGIGGLSASSLAQDGESIQVPFCGEASLPPEKPPGGQAGQCISCVRDQGCENPVALEPLYTGLSGYCLTIPASDIPDNADYFTFKAGQNCYLAEVPDGLSGDVTFCKEEAAPEISNATFYTCGGENPPKVDSVDVTCEKITIQTSNIDKDETLSVEVTFTDGTETYNPAVDADGQATVDLPGDRTPTNVKITYNGQLLDEESVMLSCGDSPAVTDVEVTCKDITIQTANIDADEKLNVTVTFEDESELTAMPTVDENGVATVELPGDKNPTHLSVTYDDLPEPLFDGYIEASDGPCKPTPPECPPDLDIAYTYKYGEWWPDPYDDIGDEVDPDVFTIEGDQQEATICAPFPFAVAYATRKERDDRKDGWDGKHEDGKKKHKHHKDCKHHRYHKHRDCKCDCFEDCKEQEPVLAEQTDSQFCATISSGGSKCKKKEICWFRVYCPDNDGTDDGGD